MLPHKNSARRRRYLRRRDSESDEDEAQRPVPKQKSLRELESNGENISKISSTGLTTKERFAAALEGKNTGEPSTKLTRRHSRILDDLLDTYDEGSEVNDEDLDAEKQRVEEQQKIYYEKLHSDSYTEKKRQEKLQKMAAERQKILDDLENELNMLGTDIETPSGKPAQEVDISDLLKKTDTNTSSKSKKSLKVKRTSTTNTNTTDDTIIGRVMSYVGSWF